jgi:hypothetical protein
MNFEFKILNDELIRRDSHGVLIVTDPNPSRPLTPALSPSDGARVAEGGGKK